ncbi:MAG: hypothetical protein PUF35_03215 [Subdoligranulum sp.]|nr:hypothetical protein [Subdoligranulum sp.]
MLDKTSSIICAFGLASAAPRSPYRHLELCGIALKHCNTLPGWQYTGQMTAGGQCSPLRRNFLLSFLNYILFYHFNFLQCEVTPNETKSCNFRRCGRPGAGRSAGWLRLHRNRRFFR